MSQVPLYLEGCFPTYLAQKNTSPSARLDLGTQKEGDTGPLHLYRGTSFMRKNPSLGPYSRTISRILWWSQWEELFLMGEAPL